MAETPDGIMAWKVPEPVVNQLISWFSCPVRSVPSDRFPEPANFVLLAGPDCDPSELRNVFAAWAEAEPDMPRLCAFSSLEDAGWEADSAAFQEWFNLVWLPVPWPLDSFARWILFRALHGDLHQFDNLPTDMALARRLEMLKQRNIDLARETVRLRQQAFTCALTGLPNRRAMDRVLAREFGHGPLRQPAALALVDIDHFKAWNERVLHTGGDLLLRGMGVRLRDSMRETDLLARIGGEEFQVLARNTDALGAAALGERLRHMVATRPFEETGQPVLLTVSVGLATVPAGVQVAAQDLARLAAKALHAAKQGGRNRVEILNWPG